MILRSVCVFIPMMIGYAVFTVQASNEVTWTPINPFRFRENAVLKCKINTRKTDVLKWAGGYRHEVLSYGPSSFHKEKYEVLLNFTEGVYYLSILDFSERDLDVVYTCFYGVAKFSRTLHLDGNEYEVQPRNDTIVKNFNISDGVLELSVIFKEVWPRPACEVLLNGKNITSSLLVNEAKTGRFDRFLQMNFTMNYQILNIQTTINLYMRCNVSERAHVVFDEYEEGVYNMHKEYLHEDDIKTTVAVTSIAGTILAIIVAVILRQIKRKKVRKRKKNVAVYDGGVPLQQSGCNSASETFAVGPKPENEEGSICSDAYFLKNTL